jgi:hypothetical protein
MWYLIIFVVLIAAMALWISRKTRKPSPAHKGKPVDSPPESYVCDICGEEGCTCHKEKTP